MCEDNIITLYQITQPNVSSIEFFAFCEKRPKIFLVLPLAIVRPLFLQIFEQ